MYPDTYYNAFQLPRKSAPYDGKCHKQAKQSTGTIGVPSGKPMHTRGLVEPNQRIPVQISDVMTFTVNVHFNVRSKYVAF